MANQTNHSKFNTGSDFDSATDSTDYRLRLQLKLSSLGKGNRYRYRYSNSNSYSSEATALSHTKPPQFTDPPIQLSSQPPLPA